MTRLAGSPPLSAVASKRCTRGSRWEGGRATSYMRTYLQKPFARQNIEMGSPTRWDADILSYFCRLRDYGLLMVPYGTTLKPPDQNTVSLDSNRERLDVLFEQTPDYCGDDDCDRSLSTVFIDRAHSARSRFQNPEFFFRIWFYKNYQNLLRSRIIFHQPSAFFLNGFKSWA